MDQQTTNLSRSATTACLMPIGGLLGGLFVGVMRAMGRGLDEVAQLICVIKWGVTGFFAALDQSGGSTPKALAEYGIERDRYSSDDVMFDLVHAMRTRVLTSPAFDGSRVLAAILFEQTMERDIDGVPTDYPECLVFEQNPDGLINRVSVFIKQLGN